MRRSKSSQVELVTASRDDTEVERAFPTSIEEDVQVQRSNKNRAIFLCAFGLLSIAACSLVAGTLLDQRNHDFGLKDFPVTHHTKGGPLPISKDMHTLNQNSWQEVSATPASPRWTTPNATKYYGCAAPSPDYISVQGGHPLYYLLIEASGGLNQQRTGITDAVVVARVLNATLVVPFLDHSSYWRDKSNFDDIFDVDFFIRQLAPDIHMVKQLPDKFRRRDIPSRLIPRKSTPADYVQKALPLLRSKKVLKLNRFDFRLANRIDPELQKLRCRANYEALRFTAPIRHLGSLIVERMRSTQTGGGRFIAVHLRFEKDMLAFSGCEFGGGEREARELATVRKRWKALKHVTSPQRTRRRGLCPLSPHEVGLLLRGLGYGNDTHLYVASGKIYGGDKTLAPLRELFPHLHTKDSLLQRQELLPLGNYQSRLAALDYFVCQSSDVFVANNHGNMARILAGQRRFNGHLPTIRPNPRKIALLMLARSNLTWKTFAKKVRAAQEGYLGEPRFRQLGRGNFHENPYVCICETPEAARERHLVHQKRDSSAAATSDEPGASDVTTQEGNALQKSAEPEWRESMHPAAEALEAELGESGEIGEVRAEDEERDAEGGSEEAAQTEAETV